MGRVLFVCEPASSWLHSAIRPVGSEDAEELLQYAMAIAAQLLHAAESRGKAVTAGNVAYYVTLLMKSGRRSQWGMHL